MQVTNCWWHCLKWCEDAYLCSRMTDEVLGQSRHHARLKEHCQAIELSRLSLHPCLKTEWSRLSLPCGLAEIHLQASSCFLMCSLQSPGTGGAQGGDARGHPSSWPSSAASWTGGEKILLLACGWVEPLISVFPSLPQLVCSAMEHVKVSLVPR